MDLHGSSKIASETLNLSVNEVAELVHLLLATLIFELEPDIPEHTRQGVSVLLEVVYIVEVMLFQYISELLDLLVEIFLNALCVDVGHGVGLVLCDSQHRIRLFWLGNALKTIVYFAYTKTVLAILNSVKELLVLFVLADADNAVVSVHIFDYAAEHRLFRFTSEGIYLGYQFIDLRVGHVGRRE